MEACVAVIISILIGAILWGIRWNGKPSIIETLIIPPEELADRELRQKGVLPPKAKPAKPEDDGSGDPKWVQQVHREQRENFRGASGHDMPE